MLITQYAPNQLVKHFTTSSTAWRVIGASGAGHANVATAVSTDGACFPLYGSASNTGLNPGAFLQFLSLRSENGSGADGSPFYFAFNRASAPADDEAELCSGSGQTIDNPGPIWNVWIKKSVAGDEVILAGRY